VDMSAVQADLKTVAGAGARILFAHQSVGRNILEGVQALSERADVPIRIEETTGRAPSPGTGLFHLFVGVNGDPSGKIVAFQRVLEDPQRPSYDVAVLKFCYEDFAHDARDHDRTLELYAAAVTKLRSVRPDVRLVHVTAPLRSDPPGWKTAVKRVLGRDTEEDADNVLRTAYNAELRSRFAAEPVFDLATLSRPGSTARAAASRVPARRSFRWCRSTPPTADTSASRYGDSPPPLPAHAGAGADAPPVTTSRRTLSR